MKLFFDYNDAGCEAVRIAQLIVDLETEWDRLWDCETADYEIGLHRDAEIYEALEEARDRLASATPSSLEGAAVQLFAAQRDFFVSSEESLERAHRLSYQAAIYLKKLSALPAGMITGLSLLRDETSGPAIQPPVHWGTA